ncbi:MAG: ABC transporter permease [Deltaproteobacteria bacterium]|nr:ABC transporter permease [Deltaproteobacteria bacterium]
MARIFYFLRRALTNMGRSLSVSGVTIGTVAVVFLFLGVFALAGHNLVLLTERLGKSLQLVVFLDDDIDLGQQEVVRSKLESAAIVSEVIFVNRAQALTRFKQRLGPEASILEGLGENPMPASFEVTFVAGGRNPEAIADLAQQMVNLAGVEEVQYGQAWLDRFFNFVQTARLLGLIVGSLILLAAIVIVSNTIRLSVYARREEIHILKLVGATDRFIKIPFYIEGVLLGLAGSGLGTVFTWFVFVFLVPQLIFPAGVAQSEIGLEFLPSKGVVIMALGGAGLGVLGTLASLWRHLKI